MSLTGRALCDECFARLTGLSAAAATLSAGGDSGAAVGNAMASSAYSSLMDRESQHRTERARKLAAAEGFWQRLKIRVIG